MARSGRETRWAGAEIVSDKVSSLRGDVNGSPLRHNAMGNT
jgi:hypothetical protein